MERKYETFVTKCNARVKLCWNWECVEVPGRAYRERARWKHAEGGKGANPNASLSACKHRDTSVLVCNVVYK
uniref:Uncharacterized protein n=1 Tax=Thermosporothrix sp. COM3 TaxID=2490863 RepID=A0A455SP05_9CHLR|nr:hypothetical protein KTC_15850 [Thermosporothrix sp. COM3]